MNLKLDHNSSYVKFDGSKAFESVVYRITL